MLRKHKTAIKVCAFILTFKIALADVLYAAPMDQMSIGVSSQQIIVQDPARLEAPLDFSTLKEIYKSPPSTVHRPQSKLIIHIQDAHSNYSGQQNLANTLDQLMEKYKISLVLVEGGTKDDTLTTLKAIASTDVWKRVAKKFLMEGKIAGEEYLNLTSDHPMKIMGIEDRDLYMKSLQAYSELAGKREDILLNLKRVRIGIEKIKNKVYPEELKEYEKLSTVHGPQTTDKKFENGFKQLMLLRAQDGRSNLDDLPNVQKLAEIQNQESGIDFNAANLEQAALVEQISKMGGKENLKPALSKVSKSKNSKLSQLNFVETLFRSAKEKNIVLDKYPNLVSYEKYLEQFGGIDFEKFFDEYERLEDEVYRSRLNAVDRGPSTVDALLIRSIDRYLSLLESAYRIQMSTKEFEMFKLNEPDFATTAYLAFINRKLADLGYFDDMIAYESIFEDAKGSLENFYQSVSERDDAFMKNTEKALGEDKQEVAVLIAGGYHTKHLQKLFKEKGYSYAVLAPHVTSETNQKNYEKVLLEPLESSHKVTGSQGHTKGSADRSQESGDRMSSLSPDTKKSADDLRPMPLIESGSRLAAIAEYANPSGPQRAAFALNSYIGARLSNITAVSSVPEMAKKLPKKVVDQTKLGKRTVVKKPVESADDAVAISDKAKQVFAESKNNNKGARLGEEKHLGANSPDEYTVGVVRDVIKKFDDAVLEMRSRSNWSDSEISLFDPVVERIRYLLTYLLAAAERGRWVSRDWLELSNAQAMHHAQMDGKNAVILAMPGTFDPPHFSHIRSVLEAWVLALEKESMKGDGSQPPIYSAILIPNGDQARSFEGERWKPIKTSGAQRIELSRKLSGIFAPLIQVSPISSDLPDFFGAQSAANIVENNYGSNFLASLSFYFVLGGDGFNNWRTIFQKSPLDAIRERVPQVSVGVLVGSSTHGTPATDLLDRFAPWVSVWFESDRSRMMSAAIRKAIPSGEGFKWLVGLVRDYVIKDGLYGAQDPRRTNSPPAGARLANSEGTSAPAHQRTRTAKNITLTSEPTRPAGGLLTANSPQVDGARLAEILPTLLIASQLLLMPITVIWLPVWIHEKGHAFVLDHYGIGYTMQTIRGGHFFGAVRVDEKSEEEFGRLSTRAKIWFSLNGVYFNFLATSVSLITFWILKTVFDISWSDATQYFITLIPFTGANFIHTITNLLPFKNSDGDHVVEIWREHKIVAPDITPTSKRLTPNSSQADGARLASHSKLGARLAGRVRHVDTESEISAALEELVLPAEKLWVAFADVDHMTEILKSVRAQGQLAMDVMLRMDKVIEGEITKDMVVVRKIGTDDYVIAFGASRVTQVEADNRLKQITKKIKENAAMIVGAPESKLTLTSILYLTGDGHLLNEMIVNRAIAIKRAKSTKGRDGVHVLEDHDVHRMAMSGARLADQDVTKSQDDKVTESQGHTVTVFEKSPTFELPAQNSSQADGARLALDLRASSAGLLDPAYIAHAMAIKNIVNPDDEPLVAVSGAAGVGVSDFLLSTNASVGYFIGNRSSLANEKILRQLKSEARSANQFMNLHEEIFAYAMGKEYNGYGSVGDLFQKHKRIFNTALIFELLSIGVDPKTIRVSTDKNHHLVLKFDWAYKGGKSRTRKIIFIEADLTKPSQYMRFLLPIDIYYQRAAQGVALTAYSAKNSFLRTIYQRMKPLGYFITDDFHNLGGAFFDPKPSAFPSGMALNEVPIPSYSEHEAAIMRVQEESGSRYGWDLRIRQKVASSQQPERNGARLADETGGKNEENIIENVRVMLAERLGEGSPAFLELDGILRRYNFSAFSRKVDPQAAKNAGASAKIAARPIVTEINAALDGSGVRTFEAVIHIEPIVDQGIYQDIVHELIEVELMDRIMREFIKSESAMPENAIQELANLEFTDWVTMALLTARSNTYEFTTEETFKSAFMSFMHAGRVLEISTAMKIGTLLGSLAIGQDFWRVARLLRGVFVSILPENQVWMSLVYRYAHVDLTNEEQNAANHAMKTILGKAGIESFGARLTGKGNPQFAARSSQQNEGSNLSLTTPSVDGSHATGALVSDDGSKAAPGARLANQSTDGNTQVGASHVIDRHRYLGAKASTDKRILIRLRRSLDRQVNDAVVEVTKDQPAWRLNHAVSQGLVSSLSNHTNLQFISDPQPFKAKKMRAQLAGQILAPKSDSNVGEPGSMDRVQNELDKILPKKIRWVGEGSSIAALEKLRVREQLDEEGHLQEVIFTLGEKSLKLVRAAFESSDQTYWMQMFVDGVRVDDAIDGESAGLSWVEGDRGSAFKNQLTITRIFFKEEYQNQGFGGMIHDWLSQRALMAGLQCSVNYSYNPLEITGLYNRLEPESVRLDLEDTDEYESGWRNLSSADDFFRKIGFISVRKKSDPGALAFNIFFDQEGNIEPGRYTSSIRKRPPFSIEFLVPEDSNKYFMLYPKRVRLSGKPKKIDIQVSVADLADRAFFDGSSGARFATRAERLSAQNSSELTVPDEWQARISHYLNIFNTQIWSLADLILGRDFYADQILKFKAITNPKHILLINELAEDGREYLGDTVIYTQAFVEILLRIFPAAKITVLTDMQPLWERSHPHISYLSRRDFSFDADSDGSAYDLENKLGHLKSERGLDAVVNLSLQNKRPWNGVFERVFPGAALNLAATGHGPIQGFYKYAFFIPNVKEQINKLVLKVADEPSGEDPARYLTLSDDDREWRQRFLTLSPDQKVLFLNIFSSAIFKDWTDSSEIVDFINQVIKRYHAKVVMNSPGDEAQSQRLKIIREKLPEDIRGEVKFMTRLSEAGGSLHHLKVLLDKADYVISVDTGITHLAAALNKRPIVLMYHRSREALHLLRRLFNLYLRWLPRRDSKERGEYIQSSEPQKFAPSEILQALDRQIAIQKGARLAAHRMQDGHEVFRLGKDPDGYVEIVPDLGGKVISWKVDGVEYLHQPENIAWDGGIPFMFPWANRIVKREDGKYILGNRVIDLSGLEGLTKVGDNPIHGITRLMTWKVVDHGSDADGEFIRISSKMSDDPKLMELFGNMVATLTYRLKDKKLSIETKIENLGDEDLSVSFGFHPYWKLPSRDDWQVLIPGSKHWRTDNTRVPRDKPEDIQAGSSMDLRNFTSLAGRDDDDVWTGLAFDKKGYATSRLYNPLTGRLIMMSQSTIFEHSVLWLPSGEDFAGLESQTSATDPFNLAEHKIEEATPVQARSHNAVSGEVIFEIQNVVPRSSNPHYNAWARILNSDRESNPYDLNGARLAGQGQFAGAPDTSHQAKIQTTEKREQGSEVGERTNLDGARLAAPISFLEHVRVIDPERFVGGKDIQFVSAAAGIFQGFLSTHPDTIVHQNFSIKERPIYRFNFPNVFNLAGVLGYPVKHVEYYDEHDIPFALDPDKPIYVIGSQTLMLVLGRTGLRTDVIKLKELTREGQFEANEPVSRQTAAQNSGNAEGARLAEGRAAVQDQLLSGSLKTAQDLEFASLENLRKAISILNFFPGLDVWRNELMDIEEAFKTLSADRFWILSRLKGAFESLKEGGDHDFERPLLDELNIAIEKLLRAVLIRAKEEGTELVVDRRPSWSVTVEGKVDRVDDGVVYFMAHQHDGSVVPTPVPFNDINMVVRMRQKKSPGARLAGQEQVTGAPGTGHRANIQTTEKREQMSEVGEAKRRGGARLSNDSQLPYKQYLELDVIQILSDLPPYPGAQSDEDAAFFSSQYIENKLRVIQESIDSQTYENDLRWIYEQRSQFQFGIPSASGALSEEMSLMILDLLRERILQKMVLDPEINAPDALLKLSTIRSHEAIKDIMGIAAFVDNEAVQKLALHYVKDALPSLEARYRNPSPSQKQIIKDAKEFIQFTAILIILQDLKPGDSVSFDYGVVGKSIARASTVGVYEGRQGQGLYTHVTIRPAGKESQSFQLADGPNQLISIKKIGARLAGDSIASKRQIVLPVWDEFEKTIREHLGTIRQDEIDLIHIVHDRVNSAYVRGEKVRAPQYERYLRSFDMVRRLARWGASAETLSAALLYPFYENDTEAIKFLIQSNIKSDTTWALNSHRGTLILDLLDRVFRADRIPFIHVSRNPRSIPNFMNMLTQITRSYEGFILLTVLKLDKFERLEKLSKYLYEVTELKLYETIAERRTMDSVAEEIGNTILLKLRPDDYKDAEKIRHEALHGMDAHAVQAKLDALARDLQEFFKSRGSEAKISARIKGIRKLYEKSNVFSKYVPSEIPDLLGMQAVSDDLDRTKRLVEEFVRSKKEDAHVMIGMVNEKGWDNKKAYGSNLDLFVHFPGFAEELYRLEVQAMTPESWKIYHHGDKFSLQHSDYKLWEFLKNMVGLSQEITPRPLPELSDDPHVNAERQYDKIKGRIYVPNYSFNKDGSLKDMDVVELAQGAMPLDMAVSLGTDKPKDSSLFLVNPSSGLSPGVLWSGTQLSLQPLDEKQGALKTGDIVVSLDQLQRVQSTKETLRKLQDTYQKSKYAQYRMLATGLYLSSLTRTQVQYHGWVRAGRRIVRERLQIDPDQEAPKTRLKDFSEVMRLPDLEDLYAALGKPGQGEGSYSPETFKREFDGYFASEGSWLPDLTGGNSQAVSGARLAETDAATVSDVLKKMLASHGQIPKEVSAEYIDGQYESGAAALIPDAVRYEGEHRVPDENRRWNAGTLQEVYSEMLTKVHRVTWRSAEPGRGTFKEAERDFVRRAAVLAFIAHQFFSLNPEGRFRRFGSGRVPYIVHPTDVFMSLAEEFDTPSGEGKPDIDAVALAAAILHDVLEDTLLGKLSKTELITLLSPPGSGMDLKTEQTWKIVKVVSKEDPAENDAAFLQRIIGSYKTELGEDRDLYFKAILVKLKDRLSNIRHNLDLVSKNNLDDELVEKLIKEERGFQRFIKYFVQFVHRTGYSYMQEAVLNDVEQVLRVNQDQYDRISESHQLGPVFADSIVSALAPSFIARMDTPQGSVWRGLGVNGEMTFKVETLSLAGGSFDAYCDILRSSFPPVMREGTVGSDREELRESLLKDDTDLRAIALIVTGDNGVDQIVGGVLYNARFQSLDSVFVMDRYRGMGGTHILLQHMRDTLLKDVEMVGVNATPTSLETLSYVRESGYPRVPKAKIEQFLSVGPTVLVDPKDFDQKADEFIPGLRYRLSDSDQKSLMTFLRHPDFLKKIEEAAQAHFLDTEKGTVRLTWRGFEPRDLSNYDVHQVVEEDGRSKTIYNRYYKAYQLNFYFVGQRKRYKWPVVVKWVDVQSGIPSLVIHRLSEKIRESQDLVGHGQALKSMADQAQRHYEQSSEFEGLARIYGRFDLSIEGGAIDDAKTPLNDRLYAILEENAHARGWRLSDRIEREDMPIDQKRSLVARVAMNYTQIFLRTGVIDKIFDLRDFRFIRQGKTEFRVKNVGHESTLGVGAGDFIHRLEQSSFVRYAGTQPILDGILAGLNEELADPAYASRPGEEGRIQNLKVELKKKFPSGARLTAEKESQGHSVIGSHEGGETETDLEVALQIRMKAEGPMPILRSPEGVQTFVGSTRSETQQTILRQVLAHTWTELIHHLRERRIKQRLRGFKDPALYLAGEICEYRCAEAQLFATHNLIMVKNPEIEVFGLSTNEFAWTPSSFSHNALLVRFSSDRDVYLVDPAARQLFTVGRQYSEIGRYIERHAPVESKQLLEEGFVKVTDTFLSTYLNAFRVKFGLTEKSYDAASAIQVLNKFSIESYSWISQNLSGTRLADINKLPSHHDTRLPGENLEDGNPRVEVGKQQNPDGARMAVKNESPDHQATTSPERAYHPDDVSESFFLAGFYGARLATGPMIVVPIGELPVPLQLGLAGARLPENVPLLIPGQGINFISCSRLSSIDVSNLKAQSLLTSSDNGARLASDQGAAQFFANRLLRERGLIVKSLKRLGFELNYRIEGVIEIDLDKLALKNVSDPMALQVFNENISSLRKSISAFYATHMFKNVHFHFYGDPKLVKKALSMGLSEFQYDEQDAAAKLDRVKMTGASRQDLEGGVAYVSMADADYNHVFSMFGALHYAAYLLALRNKGIDNLTVDDIDDSILSTLLSLSGRSKPLNSIPLKKAHILNFAKGHLDEDTLAAANLYLIKPLVEIVGSRLAQYYEALQIVSRAA